VAKPELGSKHQCQSCGTRFFDLNKTPATCPKCGTVSQAVPFARAAQNISTTEEYEVEVVPAADLVPLEDAEGGEDKVVVVADDDVEIEPSDDDPFLEEEEEDNDDVGDLIDGEIGEEEER